MANEQNLRNIQLTHEEAVEVGRKGGKVRSIAKKLASRVNCNNTCPLWTTCWAKPIAHDRLDKEIEEAKEKGIPEKELKKLKAKCALKDLPKSMIERTTRLIKEGEHGFNQEIIEQTIRYGNSAMVLAGDDPTKEILVRGAYLNQLRESKKAIFGTKQKIEGMVATLNLTAEQFATAWEEEQKNKRGEK